MTLWERSYMTILMRSYMTFGYLYLKPIDFLGEPVFLFYGALKIRTCLYFYESVRVSVWPFTK